MYYLITYARKSYGGRYCTFYNAVINIHPLDFILNQSNNNSTEGEAVLLWAQEITKEQYDKSYEEFRGRKIDQRKDC
jgi:hypothetical protein